jgi:hypothetical protein
VASIEAMPEPRTIAKMTNRPWVDLYRTAANVR